MLFTLLNSFFGVIILLGGLIFFHELGHYTVAKLFGIRVEVFSLGFGKKILKKVVGETEYCLSLFPLGGYVKLMGDDPYKPVPAEDAERAFSTQKLYKRFAVVAAGPIANLILAFVLFALIFFIGVKTPTARVGSVVYGSPAWNSGIRPKDRILEIDGTPVTYWKDIDEKLRFRIDSKMDLKVERGGTDLRIPFTVVKTRGHNAYGQEEDVGALKGAQPYPISSRAWLSNPDSAAYRAGLRSEDTISKIGSVSVESFEEMNDALAANWKDGEPITISVQRTAATKAKPEELNFLVPAPKRPKAEALSYFGLAEVLGIYPSDVFVRKVNEGSPAEKGGMQNGDRIVKVGGQPIYNFESIQDIVQAEGAKGGEATFTLERAGKMINLNLKPVSTTSEDPITRQPVTRFLVGFAPAASYTEAEELKFKIRQPMALLSHSARETVDVSYKMVVSIWKLVTRQLSAKNLGGFIMIAQVAGQSLDAGIVAFLHTMALISLNLFLLNLLPVPVLDGGHLFFFTIEAVKRKPVSIRTMEIATQLGMAIILALVVLTLFNDITRLRLP